MDDLYYSTYTVCSEGVKRSRLISQTFVTLHHFLLLLVNYCTDKTTKPLAIKNAFENAIFINYNTTNSR